MFHWARWWLLLLLFSVLAFGFRLLCWQWLNEGQTDPWNNYGAIMFLRARIDQFFFGVLAAWAHLHLARDSRTRSLAAGLGALALFALLPSIAARGDFFVHADFPWILIHYAVSGSALALIVFGAAGAGRWAQALLANRVAAWLGALSYSLYLWHFPVLQWTQAWGLWENVPRALLVPVAAIAMLALAWLSYRLIERRFMHD
jgi:peptidoglycan/LPS O-acetylase OafA/YrhL